MFQDLNVELTKTTYQQQFQEQYKLFFRAQCSILAPTFGFFMSKPRQEAQKKAKNKALQANGYVASEPPSKKRKLADLNEDQQDKNQNQNHNHNHNQKGAQDNMDVDKEEKENKDEQVDDDTDNGNNNRKKNMDVDKDAEMNNGAQSAAKPKPAKRPYIRQQINRYQVWKDNQKKNGDKKQTSPDFDKWPKVSETQYHTNLTAPAIKEIAIV